MRAGELQQVGPPQELYNEPVNLFVAGFIGSPSMNFTTATVSGDSIKLPFAEVPLSEDLKKALGDDRGERKVIAGLRPGHFEDASLIDEEGGVRFEVEVDLVESMGSELFVYFTADHDDDAVEQAASQAGLEELSGGDTSQMVARLDPSSKVSRGEKIELWLDTGKLLLFDPESGERITAGDSAPTDF